VMPDREKSDPAIVAEKPTNKAGQPAAESAEPRVGAEGNASWQSTHRTQGRERVSQALERKSQGKGRRRSSRRSSTTSALICSGKRSSRSSAMPLLAWTI
jgi:hypothetical protein